MKHDWITMDTFQWGKTRGGRACDALTRYECRSCHTWFGHRYNKEPDIYAALAARGLDGKCEGSDDGQHTGH